MAEDNPDLDLPKICEAVSQYYAVLGKPYDNTFEEYVEENGMVIADELAEGTEGMLVDFDEDNFPFPGDKEPEDKKQFIFNLLQKCIEHPESTFDCYDVDSSAIPEFTDDIFAVDEKEIDNIKKIYQKQCKVLWNNDWRMDIGLLTLLAVGKKKNFDYLLHLVDDLSRWRAKNMGQKKTPKEWSLDHKHFKQLQNVQIKRSKESTPELVVSAMHSFSKRVCGALLFKPQQRIDDSLERIIYYIYHAVTCVSNLVQNSNKTSETVCPFMIDFCIISGATVQEGGDDDDDDDDNDDGDDGDDEDDGDDDADNDADDDEKSADAIGELKEILKDVKSKNVEWKKDDKESRVFTQLCQDVLTENKLALHKKRLISAIDRRQSKRSKDKGDDIWMYVPPDEYADIPNDAVPESFLNQTMAYLFSPILGAKNNFNGGVLTLSFHVKQENVIKCYLFYNAQVMRFMPEDIKTVLPTLFSTKFPGNKDYVKNNEKKLDSMIKEMKGKLKDKEFNAFIASYDY